MGRSGPKQSKHDQRTPGIAAKLQRQGYDVKADVPGFERPGTIGGYRTDVVAKKRVQ